jgi:hypothetical protein
MQDERSPAQPDGAPAQLERSAPEQAPVPRWHRVVAAVVSLVIPGGGQLALGRIRRALVLI